MKTRLSLLLLCFTLFASFAGAKEVFRKFTTDSGQVFTPKVISFKNQTFFMEKKNGKIYPINTQHLSDKDKSYLQEVSREGKIPMGNPNDLANPNVNHQQITSPQIKMLIAKIEALEKKISKKKGTDTKFFHTDVNKNIEQMELQTMKEQLETIKFNQMSGANLPIP